MTKHDAYNAIGYGLGVIQAERVRQIEKHGFLPDADKQYTKRELLDYARYWMTMPREYKTREVIVMSLRSAAPSGWGDEWFKYDERTPEERLARAGALIAAEIDRIRPVKANGEE